MVKYNIIRRVFTLVGIPVSCGCEDPLPPGGSWGVTPGKFFEVRNCCT